MNETQVITNSQNMTVVLFYNTIAQPKIRKLVGIVYTPPNKFQPITIIMEIIQKCWMRNLAKRLNFYVLLLIS